MSNSIIIDVDGTLCEIKQPYENYLDVEPKSNIIDTLKQYKRKGYRIVLYTSRNMRTFKNNIGEINAKTLPTLLKWLEKHEIPFDEIYVGKPWPGPGGFYVDDRTVRPDEFASLSEEEIKELLGASD